MYEYLRIVRKIEPCPPPPPNLEFGQKIWAEKQTDFFWSSSVSFGFYLPFLIPGYAPAPPPPPPPFENPAYATGRNHYL